MNQDDHTSGRTFADVLADMKEELKDFIETRLAILKAELREKASTMKIALPLAILGLALLGTAYLLFTSAVVALVATFLPDGPYRWCLAFAAVAVLWTIFGGIAAFFAKREFAARELLPQKTIAVLKQDKLWLQSEVKNQL